MNISVVAKPSMFEVSEAPAGVTGGLKGSFILSGNHSTSFYKGTTATGTGTSSSSAKVVPVLELEGPLDEDSSSRRIHLHGVDKHAEQSAGASGNHAQGIASGGTNGRATGGGGGGDIAPQTSMVSKHANGFSPLFNKLDDDSIGGHE
jgi:hypothetical protein